MNLRAGRQMVEKREIFLTIVQGSVPIKCFEAWHALTLFYRHLIGAEAGSYKPVSCSWWFISFNDSTEKRVPCFFLRFSPFLVACQLDKQRSIDDEWRCLGAKNTSFIDGSVNSFMFKNHLEVKSLCINRCVLCSMTTRIIFSMLRRGQGTLKAADNFRFDWNKSIKTA